MGSDGRSAAAFDYVVVGSGAGGGPLAANLAKAGMRVVLLEAGTDTEDFNYQVPCFHGLATEDPQYKWDFFVRHYADEEQQQRDTKYVPDRGGVLYPRAGTLGGCTSHNAMITMYPHNQDWDHISAVTGDESWRSDRMRRYFERLERCRYGHRPWAYSRNPILAAILRALPVLSRPFRNPGRHGYSGWLTTTLADPTLAIKDEQLLDVVLSAAKRELAQDLGRPLRLIEDLLIGRPEAFVDPNDWRVQKTSGLGLWLIPLAVASGKRNSTREYIREVQRQFPDNLVVRTGCLATTVLLDGDNRAVGVEYVEAEHAYGADPAPSSDGLRAPTRRVLVDREVILCGGAFNTPQLLKLSGIGPREELSRFGIDTKVDLPGVGENLQDRYEVGVVTEMDRNFVLLEGTAFRAPIEGDPPDPAWQEWLGGKGLYCTNGAVVGIVKKSSAAELPDLFIFGLPASFRGYFPGYSLKLADRKNFFTWAILKAHTENKAGTVRLRSANPRDVPEINFHYFDEGSDQAGKDLQGVVEGVRFARRLMSHASEHIRREVVPGPDVQTDEQIANFVRNEAWGHHASCTCKMGPRSDPMAVVDSRFRVHGTQNLRVVDASVFPKIPGFFIVTAVYMVSEKASDVILADVPTTTRATRVAARVVAPRLGRMRGGKSPTGVATPSGAAADR